ncbi:MAG TPA: hypothetical protein VMV04_23815, partial [Thermodesulfobacteriota bacterium]|nr:hypothetical protein [Thermodesulfobacteriota bacterium]
RFSVWLPEFEGGRVGIHVMTGVDPGYPQRGPYEGSEGTSPGRTQGKTGGGQEKTKEEGMGRDGDTVIRRWGNWEIRGRGTKKKRK